MAVKKKRIVSRKKWYDIVSPKIFNNKVVGETPAGMPEKIKGRTIQVRADKLFNNRSFRNITVTLKIKDVKNNRGITEVKKVELDNSYIQRKARGRSKINIIKKLEAKSGEDFKVNISAVTLNRCNTSTKNSIRKKLDNLLTKDLKNSGFEKIVLNLISGSFQKKWKKNLHDIFPIISIELEKLERIVSKKKKE